jgi:hypothetical protein
MRGRFRRARIARLMLRRAWGMRLRGIRGRRGIGRAGMRESAYDTAGDYFDTGQEEEIGAELRRRRSSSGASSESRIIRPSESFDV